MPKKRITEERISFVLRQAERGTPGARDLPQARNLGTNLLPLEVAVCGDGFAGDPAARQKPPVRSRPIAAIPTVAIELLEAQEGKADVQIQVLMAEADPSRTFTQS